MKVGVLHPGAMGATVCAALHGNGHDVLWLSAGRGAETRARAAAYQGVPTLQAMTDECDVIVSVCPPHAAFDVAQSVADTGYTGIFLDGNAISPASARKVAASFDSRYVDGGIVGPPATQPNTTRLFLSGANRGVVADLFRGSNMEPIELSDDATAASTLKMCYAAYTKGSSALLLAVRALAEEFGVSAALEDEWQRSQPQLIKQVQRAAQGTGPKAWRFVGEMEEIAATFADGGLPSGFHEGAAELYRLMAPLKDADDVDLAAVLQTIANAKADTRT